MYKLALISGAIFGALSVILGAFGAHALKQVLGEAQLQTFETAVRYQMSHSILLLMTGILYQFIPTSAMRWAAIFFIIGILLFSGSLYLLVQMKMSGKVGLGGIGLLTPIGGLFFILGWIMLLVSFIKYTK